MKREILFRGKSIGTGEWLYGHLFKYGLTAPSNVPCICVCVPKSWEEAYNLYTVHPDTIGQYTGLKDKNGKKIFEGDIVHIKGDGFDGKEVGVDYHRVVTFHDGMICLSVGDVFHMPINYYVHGLDDWDVVGNITDTPELMK